MNNSERIMVVSGINLFEAGPLKIYYNFLDSVLDRKPTNLKIIAFVHKRELFIKYEKDIEIIEIPKSRESIIYRLFYEYVYFFFFSKKRKIDYWVSLHDMTPNVIAKNRFVYCHNPSPFVSDAATIKRFDKRVYLFTKFYKYLYRINIRKNTAVIVQQEWLRQKFMNMFNIQNVIVAYPEANRLIIPDKSSGNNIFVYPAVGRAFKNHEVICKAAQLLENENIHNFKILFTLNGQENDYSHYLHDTYQDVNSICFIGRQSFEEMIKIYAESDYMIFPSLIETWGLPITEYKYTGKPIILADEEYAHETLGRYDKAIFFQPLNETELKEIMKNIILNKQTYQTHESKHIPQPFCNNWDELIDMILAFRD